MTIDNLISADVVTADGKLLSASEKENPDLFWAIRGGGGNFGIVTNFEFKLHPVGPQVLSGLVIHPFADAKKILTEYQPILANAPDELTCWAVMRKAPPLPFIPAEWHGKEVLILAMIWAGDMADGEKAMAELRGLGKPIVDVVSPHPFVGWQGAFDPLLTPGARNYWKTHDLRAPQRGSHRHAARGREDAPWPRMRNLHRPCGRGDGARRGGRDRLPAAQGAFHHERAHALAGGCPRMPYASAGRASSSGRRRNTLWEAPM